MIINPFFVLPRADMRTAPMYFALVLATPVLAASPQAEGFKKLTGAQIRSAFVGKTFTDDTHFSLRYMPGGVIGGMNMGKTVKNNKWAIFGNELCITDNFGDTCYAVWKKAGAVKLTIGGSDLSIDGVVK